MGFFFIGVVVHSFLIFREIRYNKIYLIFLKYFILRFMFLVLVLFYFYKFLVFVIGFRVGWFYVDYI